MVHRKLITVSDICIDCNLCCSSNLGIRIYPDEYEKVKDDLSNNIELVDLEWQVPYVALLTADPCPQLDLDSGKCGIYEKRPHVCRSFKCGVLNQYEKEEISYDEVQELIQTVKSGDKHLWNTRFMTNFDSYKWEDVGWRMQQRTDSNSMVDKYLHVRHSEFLTEDECQHIAHILTRDESKILKISNEHPTSYEGLTAQHNVYNLLSHPDIRPLNIPQRLFDLPLFKDFDHIAIQAWGNILRQGKGLETHIHGTLHEVDWAQNFYASNIFLTGGEPSYTHYENERVTNIAGELHIVGTHVEHGVRNNIYSQPRISMAMDIYVDGDHHQEEVKFNPDVGIKRFMYFKRS